MSTLIRLSLMLMLATFLPKALAEEQLKHDPFARPLISATLPNASNADANAQADVPWNPTLSAVMIAGKNSLVTIDGVIVKIGEVKDGYRLVQVKDHGAVFVKGGKRIELKMEQSTLRQKTERDSHENI
jgi:hypothetical protein